MKNIILKVYPNGNYTAGEQYTRRLTQKEPSFRGISVSSGFTRKRNYSFRANPCCSGKLLSSGRYVIYAGVVWVVQSVSARTNSIVLRTLCGRITNHLITTLEERCLRGEFKLIDHSPLGLSNVSKLRILSEEAFQALEKQPKKKRGSRGITSYGRRMVRNACFVLQEKYGRDRLSFLTLTLPASSLDEDYCNWVSDWAYLKHRFLDWLKKRLKRHGLEPDYVYVNEIQEKRYERDGLYAPHLHIVFVGRKAGRFSKWVVSPKDCREAWSAALSSRSSGSFETRALENLQRIKYNCGAYMAKYLSKGIHSSSKPESGNEPEGQKLSSWHGYARSLGREIQRRIVRISFEQPLGKIAWGILRKPHLYVEAGFLLFGTSHTISLDGSDCTRVDRSAYAPSITCGSGTFSVPGGDISWDRVIAFTETL